MSLIKKFNGKKNVVAEQIKKYREEQNMSYEVLSAKLELMGISIHRQSLYDIEANKRIIFIVQDNASIKRANPFYIFLITKNQTVRIKIILPLLWRIAE